MPWINNQGVPGVGTTVTATPRNVIAGNVQFAQNIPGNFIISGTNSRDAGNTGDIGNLRAGLLMGKISNTNDANVNSYAPSVMGTSTAAITTSSTSLFLPAAVVTEVARRIGSSGVLKLTGPAAASGTVNVQSVTYSAASGTTITMTAVGAGGFAAIAGSFVQPTNGAETILTVLRNNYGVRVVDSSGNSIDVQEGEFLLSGFLNTTNVINWPTDTGLKSYVKTALNAAGSFQFSDTF